MGNTVPLNLLTRRGMLLGAASIVADALLAACGREQNATPPASSATATPAPTRVVAVPSPPLLAPQPSATPTSADPVEFLWKAEHNLLHPGHVALDGRGGLYMTDDENQQVVKFDENGRFVLAWGARGTGDGQFRFRSAHQDHSPIAGIAVDSKGAVYVSDSTMRLQVFDPDGNYLRQWSDEGVPGSLPTVPSGLTIDTQGYVYVADTGNNRVLKFTSSGQFLLT